MIIYLTRQSVKDLDLAMPDEVSPEMKRVIQPILKQEKGDPFYEWAGKLFYFEGRRCLQLMHFQSKFTIYLVDVLDTTLNDLGTWIVRYLFEIYNEKPEMERLLHAFAKENPRVCLDRLTDRSMISTMNMTERTLVDDGQQMREFIKKSVFKSIDFNKKANFENLQSYGKKEKDYPANRFEQMLKTRYLLRMI